MTTIYLVRHAIAEERGPAYPDDTKRPLTKKGKEKMKRAVAGFRSLDPRIELIVSSPLVRAVQTAKILVDGLPGEIPLKQTSALVPGRAPKTVAAALGRISAPGALVLVGHEPDLGRLAAWLIGAKHAIPFRKGGIARIDVETLPPAQDGTLIWHATPGMLRALPTR